MGYEKFKDSLVTALLQRKETEGKCIQILYSLLSGTDSEILCLIWIDEGGKRFLHWNVEALYGQFLREGLKKTVQEIAYRVRLFDLVGESEGDPLTPEASGCSRELVLFPAAGTDEKSGNVFLRESGEPCFAFRHLRGVVADEVVSEPVSAEWLKSNLAQRKNLLVNALLNTYRCMRPRMHYEEKIEGYRLTTSPGRNGCTAFFYPGMQEELSRRIGGDYYVAFPNRQEAFITRITEKTFRELRTILTCAKYFCGEESMPTERIFRYHADTGRLVEV